MLSYMGLNTERAQRLRQPLVPDRRDKGHSAVFRRVDLMAALGAHREKAVRRLTEIDLCTEDNITSQIWSPKGGGSKVIFLAGRNSREPNADGGTRMVNSTDIQEAKRTLKRLVSMMVVKRIMLGSLAEGYTGGKAMIMGDPQTEKTDEVLKAFGEFLLTIDKLTTGTDLNMTERDMRVVKTTASERIVGLSDEVANMGSAEETTARGVVFAIKNVLELRGNRRGFDGIKIAIQGIGNVGYPLAKKLVDLGASVYAYDIDPEKRKMARETIQGTHENPIVIIDNEEELYKIEKLDVLSPNAGDGTIDIQKLSKGQKGKRGGLILLGAANSPLARFSEPEIQYEVNSRLMERGWEYVPDFIVNLGGLLHAIQIQKGTTSREKMYAELERIIKSRLNQAREASLSRKVSLLDAAESIAMGEIMSDGWDL